MTTSQRGKANLIDIFNSLALRDGDDYILLVTRSLLKTNSLNSDNFTACNETHDLAQDYKGVTSYPP